MNCVLALSYSHILFSLSILCDSLIRLVQT
nr:MAG TPA_asm: hypothetical protein [Caudoviricetes sp.]